MVSRARPVLATLAGAVALALLAGLAGCAAPAAGTAPATLDVHLPKTFSVAHGVMLAGHVQAPGAAVDLARITEARDVAFEPGTLTVCPGTYSGGALGDIAARLSAVDPTCTGAQSFPEASIRFGQRTRLLVNGTLPMQRFPDASLASFAADGSGCIVPSQDGWGTLRPKGGFKFLPLDREAQVFVTTDAGTRTYNGTDYAFLHDGASAHWRAETLAGNWTGLDGLAVAPAGGAMDSAMHPFLLLDAEDALRGPDAREPRSNVSGLLYEFGRVPAFVDGAVVGRLDGAAAGVALDGTATLVRGDAFRLRMHDGRLSGTFTPRLTVATQGVAVEGGSPAAPPWAIVAALWIAAAAVLAVRREQPVRGWLPRTLWGVAAVAAFLAIDRAVVARLLGASATTGEGGGATFASAVFELSLLALSWALLALPLRIVVSRLLPARLRVAGEGFVAALWIASLAAFPATMLALGHAVARF